MKPCFRRLDGVLCRAMPDVEDKTFSHQGDTKMTYIPMIAPALLGAFGIAFLVIREVGKSGIRSPSDSFVEMFRPKP